MADEQLSRYLSDPRIAQVAAAVEQACRGANNAFGYGIWSHHVVPVARLGLALAGRLGADEETVVLAALLHDYAAILDPAAHDDHHHLGAMEAARMLTALGYPDGTIAAVAACIESHRGSVPLPRVSPEAECLASADAMAHIDNVPSLLHLAFVQRGMSVAEGAEWVRAKLERSWHKLGATAREMARPRCEAALLVLASGGADSASELPAGPSECPLLPPSG
ncbi:MAG: HD domain-containing protein [Anaerolineae bacterium]